jgi:hypothetical protein
MTNPRADLATALRDMANMVEAAQDVDDLQFGQYADRNVKGERNGWVTVELSYSIREMAAASPFATDPAYLHDAEGRN